jgi:CubicO group peptidase (beta-lactamase class C family)
MRALHEQTGVPGLSAAVSVHGNLVWHGESGAADVLGGKPVQQNTVFRLASVSKAVCSVIAAKLVEDGSIDIDARAGDLMPDLPQQYDSLTLRDLMTHTSGLPHYEARDFARGRKNYASAMAGLEQLGDRDLVSPPGTTYLYSTHGFSLAGAMMEQASGKSFSELFDSTIRTTSRQGTLALESESQGSNLQTRIYEGKKNGDPRELERENFSYSWCGAGMESTATELSNFTSSLFGPRGLLSPLGQRLLTQPLPDRNGDIVITNRWVMTLGWRQSTDIRGERYIHHSGVTNGARSILAIWPKSGLAVSLLSNAAWTGRMEDTAVAFALASERAGVEKNCVETISQSYRGSFREQPITATIKWQDSAGYCPGRLEGTNALTEWLSQFNFSNPNGHKLVHLIKNRWGLVTPIGISILTGDPSKFSGLVGSGEVVFVRTDRAKIE